MKNMFDCFDCRQISFISDQLWSFYLRFFQLLPTIFNFWQFFSLLRRQSSVLTPKNIGRPSTSNVRRVAFTRSMQSDICLPFHCCKLSFISDKFWAFYAQFSIDPNYIARPSTSNVHGVTFTRSMIPSALGLCHGRRVSLAPNQISTWSTLLK